MQMVDEVKLLHAPEPAKALQQRSLDVVCLVEIDMPIKRNRGGRCHREKQPERQKKKCCRPDQQRRDQKEGRIVAVFSLVGCGCQMASGIVLMMEIDVVAEELAAEPAMTEPVMQQRLAARYGQVRGGDRQHDEQRLP
jgi:hypothetical protein